jgi:hypothetical protein
MALCHRSFRLEIIQRRDVTRLENFHLRCMPPIVICRGCADGVDAARRKPGHTDAGQNARGALEVIGENAGGSLFTPLRNIDAELRPDALPP